MKGVVVIGCGRQGQALAFDIGKFSSPTSLLLIDNDGKRLNLARNRLRALWKKDRVAPPDTKIALLDVVKNAKVLNQLLAGSDLVISAVPYFFNPLIAKAAIKAQSRYLDLGGHQETTLEIRKLAKKAKSLVLPDLGLAPGLANILGAWGLKHLDPCETIKIYCGGLPENPNLALGYKMVYSAEGLFGIYFGKTTAIRNGKRVVLEALSEEETIRFPGVGPLEARITKGMAAQPWFLEGRVKEYIEKTLRYPGHFEKIKLLESLGLTDERPREVNGFRVVPKRLLVQLFNEKLAYPKVRDFVVLRVECWGKINGAKTEIIFDCLDWGDSKRGFSSMEKMTGFSAGVVCQALLTGKGLSAKLEQREYGFFILEEALDPDWVLQELPKRGIVVRRRICQQQLLLKKPQKSKRVS